MGRTGGWLIGARGSIATVVAAGRAAMHRGIWSHAGMVTARPQFEGAGISDASEIILGGHELSPGYLPDVAAHILPACGIEGLAEQLREDLAEVDRNIRPGLVRAPFGVDGQQDRASPQSDRDAICTIRRDLDEFKDRFHFDRLVVINLASTEPLPSPHLAWNSLDELRAAIATAESVLPPSSLYAFAALEGGDAYVNFTPSLGSRIPALAQLATDCGALHAGSDGKTGETLVKSILAELFVRRDLRLLSWFGQNILGNGDGRVLRDPRSKSTKVQSKDQLLAKIAGYPLETAVGIDYVESLGEWKIAWDYIHFQGFGGSRMNMQFTWSGCDSLLAAPLVLDLILLADLAQRRKKSGIFTEVASFFKDPMGTDEQRLVAQDEMLVRWLKQHG